MFSHKFPSQKAKKEKSVHEITPNFHDSFQRTIPFNSMASKPGSSNPKLHSIGGSRKCLCSPTTHPGSFRCSFHRNRRKVSARSSSSIAAITSVQLELAMFAKASALRAFLLQIIKPSSNDLQRRRNFHPRPSRFCLMNNHGTGLAVS